MKEKRDCKIVQDLLPNYIEKLTDEETNMYIEEHLRECNECKKVLENMQKELSLKTNKRDGREVKYIKKFSNKMKVLKFILLVLILIYICVVGRRIFIMVSLLEKSKENKLYDNYYAKLYSYQGNLLTITESYNKGEDYLTTITRFGNGNQIHKITYYKKGSEKLFLTEFEEKKYIQDSEKMIDGHILPITYLPDGILTNILEAFITGVDSAYCNGKESYVIKVGSYERYIDKETGLAIREIQKSNKNDSKKTDVVIDFEYKFNTVTDNDIIKPDITDYSVVN